MKEARTTVSGWQIVTLENTRKIDAVLTTDSDCIALGARRVYVLNPKDAGFRKSVKEHDRNAHGMVPA